MDRLALRIGETETGIFLADRSALALLTGPVGTDRHHGSGPLEPVLGGAASCDISSGMAADPALSIWFAQPRSYRDIAARLVLVELTDDLWREWLLRQRAAAALVRWAMHAAAGHSTPVRESLAHFACWLSAPRIRGGLARKADSPSELSVTSVVDCGAQLLKLSCPDDRLLDDELLDAERQGLPDLILLQQACRREWAAARLDPDHLALWCDSTCELRWREELPDVRSLVPRLVARLAQCERLESEFSAALLEEKLLAMKELAYGASHEINNPLANISSRAQLLLRDEADPQRRRSLATIHSQAMRAHEMIADMMLFAKPPVPNRRQLDLASWLMAELNQLALLLPPSIALERCLLASPWPIDADPAQLAVVLRAIWNNAIEAMGASGRLTVSSRTSVDPTDGQSWAEIELRDTGPGLSPEVRRHLFDPFFSGREAGRGLGFGLSKAWTIIQQHAGSIVVESREGQGTALTIRLPRATEFTERSPRNARSDTEET